MSVKRRGDANLVLIGLALGILFWFLEAFLHTLVFDASQLAQHLFRPDPHETWMRLAVMVMFLAFALYASRLLAARRHAEAAARQANAELAQIFETAADGMRVVDRDFTVLRANDTFAALVGLPKEAIVGRKCFEVFSGHLCDTRGCPLTRALEHGERVEYDADKLRPDGRRVPCIVTATPFRRPDGGIIGIVEDFKDISERRRSEAELIESRERLRELAAHLQDVREIERSRIAREIHDELGQALTALNMDVHWLGRRGPADGAGCRAKAAAMGELIGRTMQSVRRICSELRPGILDDLGLAAAIEWQAASFAGHTGIAWELKVEPPEIDVPPALATALFRIFQEALTNVARHAQAHRVDVALVQRDGRLELRVCDDGRGIELPARERPRTFGLIGIRERVRELGGRFDIRRRPSGGTCVELSIPVHPAQRAAS